MKPTFKPGDRVIHNFTGKTYIVLSVKDSLIEYDHHQYMHFSHFKPYVEPANKQQAKKMRSITSKVSVYIATEEEDIEFRTILHENGYKWKNGYSVIEVSYWKADDEHCKVYHIYSNHTISFFGDKEDCISFCEFKEQYLDFNTEKETDMEKKELNLAELLKGCEGEKIYLPDSGEAEIMRVDKFTMTVKLKYHDWVTKLDEETLEIKPTGFAYIYPSRESFLAHPLDAAKAWEEWEEERKPKIWRAKSTVLVDREVIEEDEDAYCYWFLDHSLSPLQEEETGACIDNCRYESGNYFRTSLLAQQAAAQIRELLMKFHQEHPQV